MYKQIFHSSFFFVFLQNILERVHPTQDLRDKIVVSKMDSSSQEDKKVTSEMNSEASDMSAVPDESLELTDSSSYPDYRRYIDYPRKSDYSSTEDFEEALKTFYKDKGLKHFDEFSEDEKKEIVEECLINLVGPKMLSQKYNTLSHDITHIVHSLGYSITPDDLSKHPDYPKKTDDISLEDYKGILRKYWRDKAKKGRGRKQLSESEVLHILENLIPEDLTDHPNFPEYLDGWTHKEYAEKVERYWLKRRNLKNVQMLNRLNRKESRSKSDNSSDSAKKMKIEEMKKFEDFDEEEKDAIFKEIEIVAVRKETVAQKYGTSVDVLNKIIKSHEKGIVTAADKFKIDHPDYPKRTDGMSKEEHQDLIEKYFKLKGLRHFKDFSDEEKKTIVEENTSKFIGPTFLSEKYNTMTFVIRNFIHVAGFRAIPDDISMYPDFPKRSDNMSEEEYQRIIKKYWKKNADKRVAKNRRKRKNGEPVPGWPRF